MKSAIAILLLCAGCIFSQGQFLEPKGHALSLGYGYQFSENTLLRNFNFSLSLAGYIDVSISSGKGSLKNKMIAYDHYDESYSSFSAAVSVYILKAEEESPRAGWLLSLGFQESEFRQNEIISYAPGFVYVENSQTEPDKLITAGTSVYWKTYIGRIIVIPGISLAYAFKDDREGNIMAGMGSSLGYKISRMFIANLDLNGAVITETSETLVGLSFGIILTL